MMPLCSNLASIYRQGWKASGIVLITQVGKYGFLQRKPLKAMFYLHHESLAREEKSICLMVFVLTALVHNKLALSPKVMLARM